MGQFIFFLYTGEEGFWLAAVIGGLPVLSRGRRWPGAFRVTVDTFTANPTLTLFHFRILCLKKKKKKKVSWGRPQGDTRKGGRVLCVHGCSLINHKLQLTFKEARCHFPRNYVVFRLKVEILKGSLAVKRKSRFILCVISEAVRRKWLI